MDSPLPPQETNNQPGVPAGRFEARYLAFLETISTLRPSLHRYCARMTGSALDGEDVVQDTLFQAYRKLESFDDSRPLAPWLYRIAYNRCIDLLRRRGSREKAESSAAAEIAEFVSPVVPTGPAVGAAVEHLVMILPPKERACVLLKDVFDHSLEEIAEQIDSTVGGVKAALHRGRAKLLERPSKPVPQERRPAANAALLRLYVERFNQRDWSGVRELIAADARLLVVDRFAGRVGDSPYFGTYDRIPETWRLSVGEIDGETTVIIEIQNGAKWTPRTIVRLQVSDGKISGLTDYWFCPWIVTGALSLATDVAS